MRMPVYNHIFVSSMHVIFLMLECVLERERDLDPEPVLKLLDRYVPAASETKPKLCFAGPIA